MIENYRDHAANERTYLAWIRTAVALMAFGFVIEKFDLYLRYLVIAAPARLGTADPRAEGAGLLLIVVGLILVIVATWAFLRNRRLIDSQTHLIYRGAWTNVAQSVTTALMGMFLAGFVIRELLP